MHSFNKKKSYQYNTNIGTKMVMISWLGLILSVFYVLTACIRLCNGEQHVKSESTHPSPHRNILITQWQEWMDGCHLTQICHLRHLCEWKGKLWTSPRCPGALWVPTKLQIRNKKKEWHIQKKLPGRTDGGWGKENSALWGLRKVFDL